MRTGKSKPSKAALIEEIKKIASDHPKVIITRNFYRGKTQYKEADWQRHFATFTQFLEESGLAEDDEEPELVETNEVVGDTWNVSMPKTRISTLPELLEHCQVDTSIWEVERFVVNKYEMGAMPKVVGQSGAWERRNADPIVVPLFQVKATLKKRTQIIAIREEIESLKAEAKLYAPEPREVIRSVRHTGNMLEINIPDAHFGKLAWPAETGDRPYDVEITDAVFLRAVEALIERTKGYTYDKVLFVVGNDLFNSDNLENQTTRGTTVTTDGRYYRTFKVVRRTITQCIERLRTIAPVKVVMVPGNHDTQSVWHLGDSLECTFAKYKDVEIDNEPMYRKYHHHGQVMLMFTHGDKGKRTDFPLQMATEKPLMFGATKFRECHTGHTHMTKMDEQHGVRVRVLPALCPPDDWHSENGYTGNLRVAEAYTWNENEGLVDVAFYNDDAYPAVTTERKLVAA